MMKEANERFGVVNEAMREKYEKEFQIPFGYDFISFNRKESIQQCKCLKADSGNYIVERIYDTVLNTNNKEEIYRNK